MNEDGNDGGSPVSFNSTAVGTPVPEQDNFPSGEKLLQDGIKHDSAYDAWAAQKPAFPELDDPGPVLVDDDWRSALAQDQNDHVKMVEGYRLEFRYETFQHRMEFNEQSRPLPPRPPALDHEHE